ncbi:MAG TPA: ribosome maturation factor RimM [Caldimonas sp.]
MSAVGVSADLEPPWPADALEVGRVVGAWGVKGWIKVQPFSADPQALFSSRRWFAKPPEDAVPGRPAGAGNDYPSSLDIDQVRHHGDVVVALPRGSADRSSAEALRGVRIFVGRADFPATQADEYYWVDLIGLEVVNRQGARLGSVAGLLDTGPHSVLRVRPDAAPAAGEANERLIPFVAAYVDDVDLARKRIAVDWGLDF